MSKLLKHKKPKIVNKKIYLHYLEPQIKLDGFEFVDILKIDKIKNSSVEEIIIQDLLEYNNDTINISILNKIISKLQPNGKLHIQGLDAKAMCYGIVYSQLDISTFKILVFGSNKNNIYSIGQIKNCIANDLNNKLIIEKIKFLNGLQYYIECVKNDGN
jgi:hypothetical protein